MINPSLLSHARIDRASAYNRADHVTNLHIDLSDEDYKNQLEDMVRSLSKLQEKMFAQQKRSVLLVFQAMDAAGKDSTIERVITGINPQGVDVYSFKKPSELELSHDFLWRVNARLPGKGKIGVFNRSHYEEVLVTRVHPQFIVYQNLPGIDSVDDINEQFWQDRFESIRSFENHISKNGTTVIKFFLNVSLDEQKQRLLDRMEEPDKHWKFKLGDIKERARWEDYQHAFEQAINHTSSENAPWYIIPADDKKVMRLMVSQIVLELMQSLDIDWPASVANVHADISEAKRLLSEE
jgi:PPK2 family polyphosphate:nucleotide phosphotransferase